MRLVTFDNTDLSEDIVDYDRDLGLYRPCECGCDQRDFLTVGYLNASRDGRGFSLHAEDEDEFAQLTEVLEVLS